MIKRSAIRCIGAALLLTASGLATAQTTAKKEINPQPYYSDPALSPNGAEIAFVSGGDVWTVPAAGGEARLLVSHPDYESRPLYSPDGQYLAFQSTRTGNGDIYVLHLPSGSVKRLTYDDGNDELSAWSRDGKYIYFSSTSRDIAGMRDVFRVKREGGTPMQVADNRYINEFQAVPSPDGKALAFAARGFGSHQWWRNGSSHLDQSELWLFHEGKSDGYERITEGGAKELWPMWSPDGQALYFVSDRSGGQNLWMRPLKGTAKQLTGFTAGRVLWPTMAFDGKSIVFERDFKIWKYDIASGTSAPVAITRRGAPAAPAVEHVRLTNGFRDMSLSPDGKKVAFVAHGDVFVASAKEGGDAVRVTSTGANELSPVWAPNSNVLVYASERDGAAHLYQYNFITMAESRLTNDSKDDGAPIFSPDGKTLAFIRDGQELRVLDLAGKKEALVTKGYLGRPPFAGTGSVAWSPDGKWLAYAGFGAKSFRNIYVVPATGGEGKPVSFLGNTFGGNVVWSKDGKYILFNTRQRTENGAVARIDLVPQQPRFREDQFRDMFTEQQPAPVTPVTPAANRTAPAKNVAVTDTLFKGNRNTKGPEGLQIAWQDIRQRLSTLPLGVDVFNQYISPDGKTLVVVASVAGQTNLYTYTLDELSREPAVLKQLTFTAGNKSDVHFSADSKDVFYLESGRIASISLDARQPKPLAVSAEMDIDFNREKIEVFKQAWESQQKGFYDPLFHGVNWQGVYATYEPLAAGAQTPDELRRLLNLMVGELNASHSGVSGPPSAFSVTTGRIGLRYDRAVYEREGALKITEVVALSPAGLAGNIKAGDHLVAVDGTPVSGTTNIDSLLENKIAKRVVLAVSAALNGGDKRTVVVRPVSSSTEKGLLYKQWVQQQREYVAKVSNGRLGYVHMFDMSAESLNQLYLDMDAENHAREGVVVDIRNNNGGFVNAYALDVFSRKGYMTMTVRGLPAAPARTQLGQRALEAPTVLVINQHSLSDAEDFTEGYRALGLGKIVGEPTAGWIIYTSSVQLIDGSTIRLPFIKITDNKGANMELAPRPVDIKVSKPLGEKDKDAQLDVAVKELLQQLEAAKKETKTTGTN